MMSLVERQADVRVSKWEGGMGVEIFGLRSSWEWTASACASSSPGAASSALWPADAPRARTPRARCAAGPATIHPAAR